MPLKRTHWSFKPDAASKCHDKCLSAETAAHTISGHFCSQANVISPYQLLSNHSVCVTSNVLNTKKVLNTRKKMLAGDSHLTSASPPPSFSASCPAGPLSRRAQPHHLSGQTGPASGPSFLASTRRAAAGPKEEERRGLCWSGGRGWDNPGQRQRDGEIKNVFAHL